MSGDVTLRYDGERQEPDGVDMTTTLGSLTVPDPVFTASWVALRPPVPTAQVVRSSSGHG